MAKPSVARSRPVARLFAWFVVAGALWQPAAAHAGRLALVSRGMGPGSDKATTLVGHYVAEGIATDERYELINVSLALGNPDRDRALRQFQVAETLVQKAREAYDGLDLDTAEVSLKGALSRYERNCAYLGDFKKMADALLLLGAVRILKGNERGGTAALEQAVGMVPTAEPDPRVFNPAMRVQFSQAVAKLGQAATGTLTVSSSPSYSAVYVDGVFAGVTPLSAEGLSAGRHIVRVDREGYRPWGTPADVLASGEVQVAATLRPAAHYDAFDGLADRAVRVLDGTGKDKEERLVALRGLAELLDADSVLFTRVRLDGEKVRLLSDLYQVHGKDLESAADHAFAYDTQQQTYEREVQVFLQEAFGVTAAPGKRAGRGSTAAREADAAPDVPTSRSRARKNCGLVTCTTLKKMAVGTAIGVGGAAMVVGGVDWILAKKQYKAWRALDQVDVTQSQLRAKAYNRALMGDVLMGVGIVGMAGGIVMATVWHPQASIEDDADPEAPAPARPRRRKDRASSTVAAPQLSVSPLAGGAQLIGAWEFR